MDSNGRTAQEFQNLFVEALNNTPLWEGLPMTTLFTPFFRQQEDAMTIIACYVPTEEGDLPSLIARDDLMMNLDEELGTDFYATWGRTSRN